MIVRKKKRDVKFIIYQSLYILVISSLAMNHMTLSNLPEYVRVGEEEMIIQKPLDGGEIKVVKDTDTIMSVSAIAELQNKIDSLEKVKKEVIVIDKTRPTPPVKAPQVQESQPVVPKIKGGEKKPN